MKSGHKYFNEIRPIRENLTEIKLMGEKPMEENLYEIRPKGENLN